MSITKSLNGTNYTLPTDGEADWDSMLSAWWTAISRVGAAIVAFGNSSVPNSGTNYLRPSYRDSAADTTEVKLAVPFTGVVRAVYVNAGTAAAGGSHVFTVRKNGVDTTLTVTLAAAATSASNTSTTLNVTAGDLLSIKTTGTPASGASQVFASIHVAPA